MIAYIKRLIRNYFGFSGHQLSGFLVLLPLLAVVIFSVPVVKYLLIHSEPDFTADRIFLDSLVFATPVSNVEKPALIKSSVLVTFDPNQVDAETLIRMGIPEQITGRILRYREKGGVFRVKADLRKIYGLEPADYRRIEPFIMLPDSLSHQAKPGPPIVTNTKKEIQPFNLNTADTTQLRQIFGIGKVLAERIVKYRGQLGGFVRAEQLSEVYRLDSATITRLFEHAFIEDNFKPSGININLVTQAELDKHPYVSTAVARAIVAYRFQHGKFESVEELKNIVVLSEADIDKVKPYLTVE